VFDEWGDEMECRKKVLHSQGNVGRARWDDLGGHPYTGIFNGGGDTGFVRLSTVVPVDVEGVIKMNPTIAVKFLRDGVDSANTVANQNFIGQTGFNFFESPLSTVLEGDKTEANFAVFTKFKPSTDFQGGVGHSDFAMYEQDGTRVEEPVFPFRLRFEPTGDIRFPADSYEQTIFEQLKTV